MESYIIDELQLNLTSNGFLEKSCLKTRTPVEATLDWPCNFGLFRDVKIN